MAAPAQGKRSWFWAQGLGCGVLVATAAPLAAALPWLHVIWSAAQSWPGSLDLLASMRVVAACWGAQGGAWLMGELVPLVARQVLEVKVRARVNRLRDARDRLEAEWGLGPDAK